MQYNKVLWEHGSDILTSPGMQFEKTLVQHGDMSVYDHSVFVAERCVAVARKWPGRVDMRRLVRGALLHDYFLYDWHKVKLEKLHGFHHPKIAAENAHRDFKITKIEENIIRRHMFPLTPIPPKYRESVLVTISDKYCATKEVFVALGHKIRGLHPATHIANTVAFLLAFLPWR